MDVVFIEGKCLFVSNTHLFIQVVFNCGENKCYFKCQMDILTPVLPIEERDISIRLLNYYNWNYTMRGKFLDFIYSNNSKQLILQKLKKPLGEIILNEIEKDGTKWEEYRLELLFW